MSAPKATGSAAVDDTPVAENIVEIDVSQEMETSFLEYAYSVIYSRALPDARDGLKPVQRRILYMMSDMGLRPEKSHVKCSRVVGEVMGKLHPHGDTAIYDALVRLAQDFSLRLPLVDGHGNFGSLDDGPAAARYTEARLAAPSVSMTASLDENVVDFVPNYDNKFTQPEVLPAAIPNLLVNGASGIAVGMATNMAPHNLAEVVAAAKHLIAHPDATLDDIMGFVPGPDLPSGGTIVGLDGIRDAYMTGRGSFKMRAAATVENVTARKRGIVVTALPYLVGPEKVVEKISDAIKSKKLQGISAVQDLTDRKNGMRLVIEIKTGFDPNLVLERLYKMTPMEESFGVNNVALVGGQPRTLGLLDLLRVWVQHRESVVRRRTEHRLAKRQSRLHLVEGLLLAIVDIDKVISTIRTSDDVQAARNNLMEKFSLSDLQAAYILDLQLRRLTKFSRVELEAEQAELRKEIEFLESLLADPVALMQVVCDEMDEVASLYGTPRRTVLLDAAAAPTPVAAGTTGKAADEVSLEVADSPTVIVLSTTGRIGRTSDAAVPQRGSRRRQHDAWRCTISTTVRADIGVLTSKGRMIQVPVSNLPLVDPATGFAHGVSAAEMAGLEPAETVITVTPLTESTPLLAIGTRHGTVKRIAPSDRPTRDTTWTVISLKDGDEVIGASAASDDDELVFVTTDASLLRFPAKTVRPQGRSAGGMAGIKLAVDQQAIFFGAVPSTSVDTTTVVTVAVSDDKTTQTMSKATSFALYPAKGRATGGVRAMRFLKGSAALGLAWVGIGPPRACDGAGKAVTLPETDTRRDGSGTKLEAPVASVG